MQKMLNISVNGFENIMPASKAQKFVVDLKKEYISHPYFFMRKQYENYKDAEIINVNFRRTYAVKQKEIKKLKNIIFLRSEHFKIYPAGLVKPAPLKICIETIK